MTTGHPRDALTALQPELVGSLNRQGSKIRLPAVVIRKRTLALYTLLFLALLTGLLVFVDALRTFVISERALLTSRGRERHRMRRRAYDRTKRCDESDEPVPWKPFHSGWRSLSSCVEYDLSLRRRPLGDKGVKRLVNLLGRREYAERGRRGQLRVLNLQRQGITRRGAGYLARWLSVDPIDPEDGESSGLVLDVDRLPTAASRSIFINLEGNPIGLLGVKDLERAVDKARLNGIRVVIIGGGSPSDAVERRRGGQGGGGAHHMVKLGPIEYTRKSVEMPPWRLPVPMLKKFNERVRDNPILPSIKVLAVFFGGVGHWEGVGVHGSLSVSDRFGADRRICFQRRCQWSVGLMYTGSGEDGSSICIPV